MRQKNASRPTRLLTRYFIFSVFAGVFFASLLAAPGGFQECVAADIEISGWYATGPLPCQGPSDPVIAETEPVNLDALNEEGKPLWKAMPRWNDGGSISLPTVPGLHSSYVARVVTCNVPQKLTLKMGSDDGLGVWLDGSLALDNLEAARGTVPGSDVVTLDLSEGEHTILLKIFNLRGNHSFCFEAVGLTPPVQGRAASTPAPAYTPQPLFDLEALRMAIEDLEATYADGYDGEGYLSRLEPLAQQWEAPSTDKEQVKTAIVALQRESMLANPLIDFDRMLIVRRRFDNKANSVMSTAMGLPSLNSRTHDTIEHRGWNNEIALMSDLKNDPTLETLYKTPDGEILCEVDLHFDADRMMFSSIGTHDRWQIFEIGTDGEGLKQITPTDLPDVDFFDSCYLADGRVAVTSTASYQGLPCEGGGRPMASMYLLEPETEKIRQITFEQDSDWCPTMMNNGRLMYLRWEYSDLPHFVSRILFSCNPDGTDQKEVYGSGSYWPNGIWNARQIPGHPTKFIGVVSGHHGLSRTGPLFLFDPAEGRHEVSGVVQRILHRGEDVEPIIIDRIYNGEWPQFLQAIPLDEKYYIASMKPDPASLWGIYLVDAFDNMTLIKEMDGEILIEPLPLRETTVPPAIADRVDLAQNESQVFLTDIYYGPGLKGIPRGTVKSMRIFSYHYNYNKTGGHASVGVESGWDIKRILGTVPVEEDGSASFMIPANTPISMQPLNEDGEALQLMRSWLVGMPGEVVSCGGCHEPQNAVTPSVMTIAARRMPSRITPWRGPARPFGYKTEIQPVLDEFCVGCHNGELREDGATIPNFMDCPADSYAKDRAYMSLHPYIRRPGPESDIHMLRPMDFHVSTSELVQMLREGHHNVELNDEAWDRLVTWIDLNCPWRGAWSPDPWRDQSQVERRAELALMYAGIDTDPEQEFFTQLELVSRRMIEPIIPNAFPTLQTPLMPGLGFSAPDARRLQAELAETLGVAPIRTITFGGQEIQMVLIPATPGGPIDRPFWISTCEISNAEYNVVDPGHDSRFIDQRWKDHAIPGYPANLPEQPVIRISQLEAEAFCTKLTDLTGQSFTLPTETQWEWAARAGTASDFWYGDDVLDFGPYANFADLTSKLLACKGCPPKIIQNPSPTDAFLPKVEAANDDEMIAGPVGAYQANPWGLHDVHGNVWEWTATPEGEQAYARGGSWRDRPQRGAAAMRIPYEPYQKVFNVGFRVILPVE
jgi:formylglycine-generating enzyme required for sulfatase activity